MDITELEIEAFKLTDPDRRSVEKSKITLPDGTERFTARYSNIGETQVKEDLQKRFPEESELTILYAAKIAVSFAKVAGRYGSTEETKEISLYRETVLKYLHSELPGHSKKLYDKAASRISDLNRF